MGMGLRLGNDRATDRNEISPVVVLWWACGVLAVAVVTLIGVVVGLDGRVGKLEARVGVLERGSVEQVERAADRRAVRGASVRDAAGGTG